MEEKESLHEEQKNEMEVALEDVAWRVCNSSKPLSGADLREITEGKEELDEKELKTLAIELQKTLLAEGKPDLERRKKVIVQMLGGEPEEEEIAVVQEEVEKEEIDFKPALLEIGRIINSPEEQLTNLKIESVAENYGIEFNELKSQVKEFNKVLTSSRGDNVEKVVNNFLNIEEGEQDEQETGATQEDSKEEVWAEVKTMYLNAPHKLTKDAILTRGLTLDEVEAMIPEWKEEKKKDII